MVWVVKKHNPSIIRCRVENYLCLILARRGR